MQYTKKFLVGKTFKAFEQLYVIKDHIGDMVMIYDKGREHEKGTPWRVRDMQNNIGTYWFIQEESQNEYSIF